MICCCTGELDDEAFRLGAAGAGPGGVHTAPRVSAYPPGAASDRCTPGVVLTRVRSSTLSAASAGAMAVNPQRDETEQAHHCGCCSVAFGLALLAVARGQANCIGCFPCNACS